MCYLHWKLRIILEGEKVSPKEPKKTILFKYNDRTYSKGDYWCNFIRWLSGGWTHHFLNTSLEREREGERERERVDSNLGDCSESPFYRGGCLQSCCKVRVRLDGDEFVGSVTAEERFAGALMMTVIVLFEHVPVAPSTPPPLRGEGVCCK